MDASWKRDLIKKYESVLDCFGPSEKKLLFELHSLLDCLPDHARHELAGVVLRAAGRLPQLVQAIDSYPIAPEYQRLGRRERNVHSLLDGLCRRDWLPVDFSMPTGALMGRALVLARMNFLKAMDYTLELSPDETVIRFREALRGLIDDAIFSKLAEDLLTHAVANPLNTYKLRHAAARKLLSMWNNWVRQPVSDFPSVLLSAWKARMKVDAIYGSLFGIQEMLSLMREECPPEFVTYFTRDQVTLDETEAFREFLFGIPYEDLQELQEYMKSNNVAVLSREQVGTILEIPPRPRQSGDLSAEEVCASYWRRSIRSEYRALSSSPGPRKTAEGYIMEHILRQEL